MERITKAQAVNVLVELRLKGITQEEIAVYLGRTQQTIWAWGSDAMPKRKPCRMEFEALQKLLKEKK